MQTINIPCKTNLLADACVGLTTDLGRDGMVGLEVMCKILKSKHIKSIAGSRKTYGLIPLDGYPSAVDVGR
jgi:hypothetical protein